VFSLLLLAVVFFLAYSGIGNIALNAELYLYIILFGYLMIVAFGASKSDFSFMFPLETISVKPLLDNFVRFNVWFGDFFMVLFLGKHANGIKIKWTMLTYALAMGFVMLLFLEFGGLYGDYVVMKPSLLSTITEQSLLDLNIGRVDWFLILFAEIGSVLSCGACVYFSKKCMEFAFPKAKKLIILSIICLALYLINVFYLVDTHTRILLFMKYIPWLSAATKWLPFIIMFVICLFIKNRKEKPPKKQLKNRQKLSQKTSRKVVNDYGK
jgi:hypothetical protein